MDKQDLLSVFEFLALALKPQIQIEKEIVEQIPEEVFEQEVIKEPEVISDKFLKIKKLIDKVSTKSPLIDEDKITKIFKEQERNLAIITNKIASELRDNTATMEQREMYKNFLKLSNNEAINELRNIEIELNKPKPLIPKKSVEDIVQEKEERASKSLENYLKQNTKNFVIDDEKPVIIDNTIIRTEGMVRFREEFKNGLGHETKFGFDGKPIQE